MVEDFFSIQGLDTLWEAFLSSADTTVVNDAGDLLVQLHLRLKNPSDNLRVWNRRDATRNIVECLVCDTMRHWFGGWHDDRSVQIKSIASEIGI